MTLETVVVHVAESGAETAARAARALGGRVARLEKGAAAETLRGLFAAGHPIVGVMAAGILIRALGPMLGDKRTEPPVTALAEDGSVALPLLGGHHGANAAARRLAEVFGGVPAVTTAGDLSLGVALDEAPAGWRLERPEDAKAAMAGLLAGRPARLSGEAPWLDPLGPRATRSPAPPDAPVTLSVEGAAPLVWRRRRLALGVGCARGCPPEELIGLVRRSLAEAGLSAYEVAGVWSLELKTDEAAVHALARDLDAPARFFPAAALEAEAGRLTAPSDIVFAETGCHGVAEGAALAAAGPEGRLLLPKAKSGMATVAVAELPPARAEAIAGGEIPGRARGRLSVVGIGPGAADWRTPEASRLIAQAEELVGYGLYLDLLGPLAAGKPRADFALGEEEARCRHALERAGEGRDVALVCSGDAGIYAMGALVAELLDRPPERGGVSDAARRAELVFAPGVSALQAASARAGALLGHDFCAISLSDLLTPREDVLKRLRAAAEGDFVVALYNPVSRRRRELLERARDMLLEHRPADAPVLLARSLGRPDESLTRRRLADLRSDEVDMMTVVLVGAARSRAFETGDRAAGAGGWRLYTPRGYAKKMEGGEGAAAPAPSAEGEIPR